MKIRIYALAKELNIDSKELVLHANEAGVQLKNSALASISPEERDIVVSYLDKMKVGSTAAPSPQPSRPVAPVRDSGTDLRGRIRQIRSMAPARQQSETTPVADEAASPDVADEIIAPEEQPTDAVVPTTAPTDIPQEAEPPVVDSEVAPELETETQKPRAGTETRAKSGVVPISREDYVDSSGSLGSGMREMKPRGTTSSAEIRLKARRAKQKGRPALPKMAELPSKPTVSKGKVSEPPAQKPEVRLTGEMLEQRSPLAAHIRKHAEQKKKHKRHGTDEAETPEVAPAKTVPGRVGSVGLEEARKQRHEKRKAARKFSDDEPQTSDERSRSPRRRRQRASSGGVATALKTSALIEAPITVRSLSEALGRPAKSLLQLLWQEQQMVTINTSIDEETALDLAMELGVDLEIKRGRDIEQEMMDRAEADEDAEKLVTRPPIITVLGHVDHGKTTLLDKIRSADVAGGEVGGITQHIAAYQVDYQGHKLTFVDTPGHEAFGEMRARGANVTDIVVLVVAADDGVMPQTVEAISHAKAAGVPIVVAMNKIDLPGVDEQRILQGLSSHDVLPSEWGGDTEIVRTSAANGTGVEELLETLILTAELLGFTADPNRPATGVCLEAFRDEGRGALAWFIVEKGTLRIGDAVLCGPAFGRIRAMYNDRNEEVTEAGPSFPVKVAGLDVVPGAGNHFFVLDDLEEGRDIAMDRRERGRAESLTRTQRPRTLEDIANAARGGLIQDLPLVIKADTPGSLEALRSELNKLDHPEVRVKILHEGIGGVNESDIYLASASGAIIIAFHVVAEDRAEMLAMKEGVDVRRYNIIYEVTNEIKQALEGLLTPDRVEMATGRALVLRTFHISRYGTVAGCRVLSGTIDRTNRMHVIRDQTILNDYSIASLKREKDDAKEVREGMECGIRLDGFHDVKEGDLLEAFRIEEVKRTLD